MKPTTKYIMKALIVAVIAAAMEIFIFNFEFFKVKLFSYQENISYSLEQFTTSNWSNSNGVLVSGADAMLTIENLDIDAFNVKIYADATGDIPYTDIFYTNEDNPIISDDTCVRYDGSFVDNCITVNLNTRINSLRVDLSDVEGIALNDFKVTFNVIEFSFSIARFVAINMIYWLAVLLFAAQRPPKYKI